MKLPGKFAFFNQKVLAEGFTEDVRLKGKTLTCVCACVCVSVSVCVCVCVCVTQDVVGIISH